MLNIEASAIPSSLYHTLLYYYTYIHACKSSPYIPFCTIQPDSEGTDLQNNDYQAKLARIRNIYQTEMAKYDQVVDYTHLYHFVFCSCMCLRSWVVIGHWVMRIWIVLSKESRDWLKKVLFSDSYTKNSICSDMYKGKQIGLK